MLQYMCSYLDRNGGIKMLHTDIRSELSEVGLDCTEMIEKFMDSEEMFLKFFKKFFTAADSVVQELSAAIAADDHSAIENRAHALKGLSGNIGLNGVYNPAKKIVDDVRAGQYSFYKDDFSKLLTAYTKALSISKKL
ncbi:MAG: Hpt domain-containing protein [Ruminococcaceae bacterium]|nr:Hpt domain-containing protein [Oscillospiraceae bacterium]